MNKTKHSIEEMHDRLNTDEQLQLIVPIPGYAKYPTLIPKEKTMGPGDIDEEDPNPGDGFEEEDDGEDGFEEEDDGEDVYDDEPDNTGADDGEDD